MNQSGYFQTLACDVVAASMWSGTIYNAFAVKSNEYREPLEGRSQVARMLQAS